MPLPPPNSASVLDQMPPSPAQGGIPQGPGTSAAPQAPGLGQMGPPVQIGTGALPPEILTGVMQIGQQITSLLDGLAQVTPEQAMEWQAAKQLIEQTLAKILLVGGQPASPTSPGMGAFPGGGFEQGQLPTPGVGTIQ